MLTRLVQRMTTKPHPRTDFATTFGLATHQSDMVTGGTPTQNRQQPMTGPDTHDETTYNKYDRQVWRPTTSELTDPYEQLLNAITALPGEIQTDIPRLLQRQIPTFRGTKKNFWLWKPATEPLLPDEQRIHWRKTSPVHSESSQNRKNRVLPISFYHHGDDTERGFAKVSRTFH